MTNLQSLEFFIPELILTITILAALITDLFVKKSKTNMIGWVLGVGLVVVGLSVHNLSSVPPTTLFLDMIVIDPFSSFMKIVIILSTLLVIVASWVNDELEKYRKGEYFSKKCCLSQNTTHFFCSLHRRAAYPSSDRLDSCKKPILLLLEFLSLSVY